MATPCVLTVNGGSSSIKFAIIEANRKLRPLLRGVISGIGQPQGTIAIVNVARGGDTLSRVHLPDHRAAVGVLIDWITERIQSGELVAVGHRVVHGGPKYWEPQRITPAMVAELHQLSPFDPEHLPEEILLTEAFHERFPELPQFACFDTAFHHDLPRVAQMLAIPRRYHERGVRRYGFHGLSCEYLMDELERRAGAGAAQGRVIVAHLGNGASLTAVKQGRSIDTSMSFTPAAGIPMSTRAGDLDPGLMWYLWRVEQVTARQFHEMINHESGLLGISEISSDMRVLLEMERKDERAADAVAVFCYQARKWVGALAGALEGLDTLIFSGGIGEHAPPVRERICAGLGFLGIHLDPELNTANAGIISKQQSPVTVRVINTNEERVIAKTVCGLLGLMN